MAVALPATLERAGTSRPAARAPRAARGGGGSASLVSGGRLRNRPRAGVDRPEPGGRAVSTALLFVPR
jgi:hypothetical protein